MLLGCQSEEKTNQFLLACKYENISSIEAMIADGFDIDAKNKQGITGLMVAAAENRPNVVKLLLKHNADPNIKSKLGVSALMFASARGSDIEIIQALIDAKSDVNLSIIGKETVLMTAVSQGEQISEAYLPIIELRKAGSDEQNESQLEQILSAVAERNRENGESKVLMTANQALKVAPGYQKNNQKQLIEALLSAGADINALNISNESALYQAVNHDLPVDVINILLKAGADINKADKEGITPLMLASASNNTDLLKAVYSDALDTNQENKEGVTALQIAASYSSPEIVSELIKMGADVNFISTNNISPLMLAVKNDKVENVQLLIEKGAKIDVINADGVSAIGYSKNGPSRQFLIDNHAKLDNQVTRMAENDLYLCAKKIDDYIFSTSIIAHKDKFGMDKRYAKETCQGLGSVTFSLGEIRFEQTEKVFFGKNLQCKFNHNRFNCIEVINP